MPQDSKRAVHTTLTRASTCKIVYYGHASELSHWANAWLVTRCWHCLQALFMCFKQFKHISHFMHFKHCMQQIPFGFSWGCARAGQDRSRGFGCVLKQTNKNNCHDEGRPQLCYYVTSEIFTVDAYLSLIMQNNMHNMQNLCKKYEQICIQYSKNM